MQNLCVRIVSGKLNPANFEDSCLTYVSCRAGGSEWKSAPVRGLVPSYNAGQIMSVPLADTRLFIEIWEKRTFHNVHCSVIIIDLEDVIFRYKCGGGCWYGTQPLGRLLHSDHVLIDVHFLLGVSDAPKDELEQLERKMNELQKVRKTEMSTLRAQSQAKNFQDIKGHNISRPLSRPPSSNPPGSLGYQRADSCMTIESGSDQPLYRELCVDSSQNGDSCPRSRNSSYNSEGAFSAGLGGGDRNVTTPSSEQLDGGQGSSERSGGGVSQLSQLSLEESEGEEGEDGPEELSEGAFMWIRAMDRMRDMKYVAGNDIRTLPREECDGEEQKTSPIDGTTPCSSSTGQTGTPFRSSNMLQLDRMWNAVSSSKMKQVYNAPKPEEEEEGEGDEKMPPDTEDPLLNIPNYDSLKVHVFKKTVQALIYPISLSEPHKFQTWTFLSPAFCSECEGLLIGLTKQGMKCGKCGIKCHQKCQELMNADCLQRARQKSKEACAENSLLQENITRNIEQRIKVTENSSQHVFELLRDAFGYGQDKLDAVKKEVKHSILTGSSKWSAKIEIEVVEAVGLAGKDKSGTSDPYVTVQIGKLRKRTNTILQDLNPKWRETFSFECNNSSDRIKVRVWDEDDDLKSKLMTQLKREADDFLGQTTIDVKQLCGETDVWYDLKQRTDKSDVSGQIHLRMTIKIEGETQNMASYHTQYQILHETLFSHMYSINGEVKIPEENKKHKGNELDEWPMFFDKTAQCIVEEFATRYGIESIFMAMTQFSCLTRRFITKKDAPPQHVSRLLAYINTHYRDRNGQEINVSNFGKQRFTQVLDRLQFSLRQNLTSYKAVYPAIYPNEEKNMADLKNSIDLLTSIVFFRLKVLQQGVSGTSGVNGGDNTRRTNGIIKERVTACLVKTYHFISKRTEEIYASEYKNTEQLNEHPKTAYWKKLIFLIIIDIRMDKKYYDPVFRSFFNHADLSAETFWEHLSRDLKTDLTENVQAYLSEVPTDDIMMLQLQVKTVYDKYVSLTAENVGKVPEFPKWFEPFVMKYLEEADDVVRNNFLVKSLEKDKFVAQVTSGNKHSSSVIDIFTSLHGTFEQLEKLDCPVADLRARYYSKFCQTIDSVLMEYIKRITVIFKSNVTGLPDTLATECVILCNVHQLREELQSLYKTMGGDNLDLSVRKICDETQKKLKETRNSLVFDLVDHLRGHIEHCIREIKGELRNVKSKKDEDILLEMLSPLLMYYEKIFDKFVNNCYEAVRKPLLRHAWKVTLRAFEEIIILPDINTLCHEEVQELNNRQSQVVENMLNYLKNYFTDNSDRCTKAKNLEKMSEMKHLRKVLSDYRLTTDTLIKNFVNNAESQNWYAEQEDSLGELQLQVDLFSPPGQEHHDLTVKVVSASRLNWNTTKMFKPFVEVNLIGPGTSGVKRRFTTGSKTKTYSPLFNESFHLKIIKPNEPNDYELQFSVKDWCFVKTDQLVGVAVMPLRCLIETGSIQDRLALGRCVYLTKENMSIVIILSQRVHDEVAQEFVKLKKLERTEII